MSSWTQTASWPSVKDRFTWFTLRWHTFRAGATGLVSFSDPSVLSSLQGTEYVDSSWVFIYRRSRPRARCSDGVWTCSYPPPPPDASSRPQLQSVIFLLCLPKGQINNKSLLLDQTTLQASWQASPFSTKWQDSRSAEDSSTSTRVDGNWNTVYHLVFTRHFWATVQFSFLM